MKSGVVYALAAAVLFGASTPFAKLLVGQIPPIVLAGLLYLGSGIGLLSWLLLRRRVSLSKAPKSESFLTRADLPWVVGAIVLGGIAAPLLLMSVWRKPSCLSNSSHCLNSRPLAAISATRARLLDTSKACWELNSRRRRLLHFAVCFGLA